VNVGGAIARVANTTTPLHLPSPIFYLRTIASGATTGAVKERKMKDAEKKKQQVTALATGKTGMAFDWKP